MTVNTTNITSGPYAGNDVADTFSYTFRVADKTQLSVYETDDNGVQTLLVVDTDYTVTGVGVDGGGTVVRTTGALPTGYEWYIRSNYQETQLTAFASQGGFFPDVHEDAFDKLTFLIQQILEVENRSIRLPAGESSGISTELESILNRANKLLGFTSTGEIDYFSTSTPVGTLREYPTVSSMVTDITSITIDDVIIVSEYSTGNGGGGVWDAVTYDAGANGYDKVNHVSDTSMSFQLRYDSVAYPKQWGAVGDGSTSDLLVFQEIVSKVQSGVIKIMELDGSLYFLGTIEDADINTALFSLSDVDNFTVTGNARFKVTNNLTLSDTIVEPVYLFQFTDCNDLTVKLNVDGGSFNSAFPKGLIAVYLYNDDSNTENAYIDVTTNNCLAGLDTETPRGITTRRVSSDVRWQNIIVNINAKNGEYGARFIGCGDNAAGFINTKNIVRSYFNTGVSDHNVLINSSDHTTFTDVLIKCYRDDISNLNIVYNARNNNSTEAAIVFEHQNNEEDTSITDVNLTANVYRNDAATGDTEVIRFVSKNSSGTTHVSAHTITDRINIKGNLRVSDTNTIRIPTIKFDTHSYKPATINIEGDFNHQGDYHGYTIRRGNKYYGNFEGDFSANKLQIRIPHLNAFYYSFRVRSFGVDNDSSTSSAVQVFDIDQSHVFSVANGVGTERGMSLKTLLESTRNTAGTPSVVLSIAGFDLNSNFQWTLSASGTNEYYLEQSGGGNPRVIEYSGLNDDGVALASGAAGSLAAGQFDYADNDSLGYSTIYARLSDDTDPDASVMRGIHTNDAILEIEAGGSYTAAFDVATARYYCTVEPLGEVI